MHMKLINFTTLCAVAVLMVSSVRAEIDCPGFIDFGVIVDDNVVVNDGTLCQIFGEVNGDVLVAPTGFLAVGNITGFGTGTVNGTIVSTGGLVLLGDGALIFGDVIQNGPVSLAPALNPFSPSNVYFVGTGVGAMVLGNVEMNAGTLSAIDLLVTLF